MRNMLRFFEHECDDKTENETSCCSIERLLLVKLRKYKTTNDTGSTPCSQNKAIDFSYVGRPEGISRKRGHDGETTAQTGKQVAGDDSEYQDAADLR